MSSNIVSKLEVARQQLGTALQLFIWEADPISVHTLAGAGAEVADGLARQAGKPQFVRYEYRGREATFYKARNKIYNALKHNRDHELKSDTAVLSTLSERANADLLFVGLHDLAMVLDSTPIELGAFLHWYAACFSPELYNDLQGFAPPEWTSALKHVSVCRSPIQRRILRTMIDEIKADPWYSKGHPEIDYRPLIVPGPI